MLAPADSAGFDGDRTRPDESGTTLALSAGRLRRGSILAGKYRLEMLLAEGGMGFVWSAYHLELELPVALKLLRAQPNHERLAERLRIEARAAARLVHPSIVRVFDIDVTGQGDPFLVMELLTGESLAQSLTRGPFSPVEAVRLLLPIADALALAHAKGVVHRDLKPDNIFLSTDDDRLQPKLLDFGIAKLEYASPPLARLTDKGTALGSPNYMSPEQVLGETVDYRSDIWSFGVVLYKAITGTAPFKGSSARAIMDAILNDEPAALPASLGIDAEFEHLIRFSLAKDPARRPTSMRVLHDLLSHWLVARGASTDPGPAPPSVAEQPPDPQPQHPSSQRLLPVAIPPDLAAPTVRVSALSPRRRRWALLAAVCALVAGSHIADAQHAPRSTTALAPPTSTAPASTAIAAVAIAAVAPSAAPASALPSLRAAPRADAAAPAVTMPPAIASAQMPSLSAPSPRRAVNAKSPPARTRPSAAPQLPF